MKVIAASMTAEMGSTTIVAVILTPPAENQLTDEVVRLATPSDVARSKRVYRAIALDTPAASNTGQWLRLLSTWPNSATNMAAARGKPGISQSPRMTKWWKLGIGFL